MDILKFKGLGVALVTPFTQTGDVDHTQLAELVENLISNGVDYLVALGTTGETPTLSDEEKEEVLQTVIRTNAKRVPIMMGLGGPSTRKTLQVLTEKDFTGIDAILSVAPYYNRPTQVGLYEHYSEIAYHSPLPVMLYNVPARTSCNIEAETTLRLARNCEKIFAIKEASGMMNQIMYLAKHKPDNFLVISGDDAVTLPLMAAGVNGLISVIGNAFPKVMSEMVHSAINQQFDEALRIHFSMLDIIQACFKEGNPSGIKAILALQGKIEYYLRLPLTRVSSELQSQYKNLLAEL